MLFSKKRRESRSMRALPIRRALRGAQERYTGTPFEIGLPDGGRLRFGLGVPAIKAQFTTWRAVYDTWLRGTLGLGEGYARGEVSFEGELEDGLTAFVGLNLERGLAPLEGLPGRSARSLGREKAGIEHHPERSDDFYRLYLDKKLQHSCGYFHTPDDSLDLAQEQKLAFALRKLAPRPGQRLLDLGCGWGHLMFQAAETYGVECLGITLSDTQAAYIREQAAARRLPVKVRVMNYLDLEERVGWDRIISTGMRCHVGERRIDPFWDKMKALLVPGGICLIHCLATTQETSGTDPFVRKHVLPGCGWSSLEGIVSRAAARGLNVLEVESLRRHYALTARCWRQNFLRSYDDIKRVTGVDDAFMRTWEFSLASVVAGFRAGHMNLLQAIMSNGIQDDYPLTRELLYIGERGANGAAARPDLLRVPSLA